MNILKAFLGKVGLYLGYMREDYLFYRSQKFVNSWGEGTYGKPTIVSYDLKSSLSVGSYVSIAGDVSFLLGANHKRGLLTTYPLTKLDSTHLPTEANEPGDIVIGNDVWIGYGATVIGPAKIGDGAIIGAHALVIKDVPPYAVVGGVPAQVLKFRFEQEIIERLLAIKWWTWDKETILARKDEIYNTDIQGFIKKYS